MDNLDNGMHYQEVNLFHKNKMTDQTIRVSIPQEVCSIATVPSKLLDVFEFHEQESDGVPNNAHLINIGAAH